MALPTNEDVVDMTFVSDGQPFVSCPAKTGIDLTDMTIVYNGQPFVRNGWAIAAASMDSNMMGTDF